MTIDTEKKNEYTKVFEFLEDISIEIMHVKNLLEVLVNEEPENLSMNCNVDLIHIAYDYIYNVMKEVDTVIEKVDFNCELKEREVKKNE